MFTHGSVAISKLMEGYKINKPLSGLQVCQLIMCAVERIFILALEASLSAGHYQPTYQPPEGVYLLNIYCALVE